MGNSIGRQKRTKVMKINGDILKLKTPIRASDILKDYPDHVLFDFKAAKKFGVRAQPLHPRYQLEAGKIYFLIELPKLPVVPDEEEKVKVTTRRVKSAAGLKNMSAMDRLEFLKLSRRSISDLSMVRPPSHEYDGPVQVKMRLPRAQVDKLIQSSKDEAEVSQKLIDLYMQQNRGKIV